MAEHKEPEPDSPFTVTVESTSVVKPSDPTERRSEFLSNFDQILLFMVYTVHVFPPNPLFSFDDAVTALKQALGKVLVRYDFLAGRFSYNPTLQRMEIDCNSQGINFAVAVTDTHITDLGDTRCPNPSYRKLVLTHSETLPLHDRPLCVFQVTRFGCGSVVMGMGTSHAAMDGITASAFLANLASVMGGKGMLTIPTNDRTLLKARDPPRVEYDHVELMQTDVGGLSAFQEQTEDVEFGVVSLSGRDVEELKRMALQSCNVKSCTSFEAVTAHIWRARTAAGVHTAEDDMMISWVMFAVDIRGRMVPPLPREYSGNAVFHGYASAPAWKVKGGGVGWCVAEIQKGISRLDDAYVRSCIDWGEIWRGGVPRSRKDEMSMMVSSWWRIGMNGIQYPWCADGGGAPLYSGPAIHDRPEIVLLLPHPSDERGVCVYLGLPPSSLSRFRDIFYRLHD